MNLNLTNGACNLDISVDCDSNQNQDIHPDNLKKVNPSNGENPYDEVGAFHNYAMRRIFLNTGETEFSQQDVIEKLQSLAKRYPFQSKELKAMATANLEEVMAKIEGPLYTTLRHNWMFPPTPDQIEHIPEFLRDIILWSGGFMGSFDKRNESLLDRKNDLVAYERNIAASKLNKETKAAALVSLSIVRHSSILYIEHFNGGGGTGPGPVFAKCNCKAVARVAVADVVGAATGFLTGGAPGAVVGGIVGSGKQLIDELD